MSGIQKANTAATFNLKKIASSGVKIAQVTASVRFREDSIILCVFVRRQK
jgi:hypothetical protein